MKGYRLVGLTSEGKIPDEVGEKHYFSTSLERVKFYEKMFLVGQEPVEYFSQIKSVREGYAIVEVEAEVEAEDPFWPGEGDFFGRISSVIRVVKLYETAWLKRKLRKKGLKSSFSEKFFS